MHLIPADDISPAAIRQSLLHYAQTILTPHKERQHQDTTLEEAIACLVHAPARNHSQLELHQAAPWDKDHIDARYESRIDRERGLAPVFNARTTPAYLPDTVFPESSLGASVSCES